MDESVASLSAGDDVKPYKIHVSSKYLERTRKKLELTRLPHELLLPRSRQWSQGTPKSEIEPLIDFWLETYSWKTQESHLNATLPQFRTAISISPDSAPIRVHFVHIKSSHAHAVPLLLLPSFPLTNLSLIPLLNPLADPENPWESQSFHIIAPSIPGLGFSDAFASSPDETSLLESTAQLFNILMMKLGYESYIASSTGSGSTSPANIDYHLPRVLAANHPENCLGIHLIDPPVEAPTLSKSPWDWTKFAIAKFFHAPIFGYTAQDWSSLSGNPPRGPASTHRSQPSQDLGPQPTPSTSLLPKPPRLNRVVSNSTYGSIGLLGLREPNTLAYALCDSPVGLLSLVLNGLKRVSPRHNLSRTEIINVAQLAWLPGPEGAMRYWSGAEAEAEKKTKWLGTSTAVTVFLGDGQDEVDEDNYRCPAWAQSKHRLVWVKRQVGSGGLVAWERTDCIIEGIRGLASEIAKHDPRLGTQELEQIVVDTDFPVIEEEDEVLHEDSEMQMDVESPDTVVMSSTL